MLFRLVISPAVIALASVVMVPACAQSVAPTPGLRAITGPQAPSVGESIETLRGPAAVTGNLGSMATTTLPGGGEGLLMDNGNGTSTLIGPNGALQAVPTPR